MIFKILQLLQLIAASFIFYLLVKIIEWLATTEIAMVYGFNRSLGIKLPVFVEKEDPTRISFTIRGHKQTMVLKYEFSSSCARFIENQNDSYFLYYERNCLIILRATQKRVSYAYYRLPMTVKKIDYTANGLIVSCADKYLLKPKNLTAFLILRHLKHTSHYFIPFQYPDKVIKLPNNSIKIL